MNTEAEIEAMCLGAMQCQDCQQSPEAGDSQAGTLPQSPQGELSTADTWGLALWPQDSSRTHFCCFKPPGLLSFVSAVLDNECILSWYLSL